MKKLLSLALAAVMLLSAAASVIADEPATAAPATGLTEESILQLKDGVLVMVDGAMKVSELKSNFNGSVAVVGADGTAKADDKDAATDDIVTVGSDEYKILLYGDADRNGKISLTDVSFMMQVLADWDASVSETASDVDANGKFNLSDVSLMLQYIAGWENISLGKVRMLFENVHIDAEKEDSTLDIFFTDMMNKIDRRETDHTGFYSYKMDLAKNETESCNVMIYSENEREGISAELSDFEYEFGGHTLESKLEWIFYYNNDPEVCLPMTETFELEAGLLQHMVISVTSAKDARPGMYVATLSLKDADGNVIKTSKVYANVWDFALPDTPYSASIFNTNYYTKSKYSYADYFEFMLDNNLSSYVLPVDITEPEADAYMSDPRVTAFVIAGDGYGGIMNADDEETVANYKKVMSNPDWAKKGLFYYTDEPWGAGLEKVKTTYEHLINLLGTDEGVRNITPLGGNNTFVDKDHENRGIDPVTYIDPYINVWCPQSPAFHLLSEGGLWTPRRLHTIYGDFADRAKVLKENGEEMWWYLCASPLPPYANYFTWYQGAVNRVVLWQQYFNDVDGQLYYATGVHWDKITKYQFDITNGDGVMMYPGEFFGHEGPQASWRLYQLRDGWDDFDYLSIAEELLGRPAVMEVVKTVTTGMVDYTDDYRVIDAARDTIMKMIVEAQAKAE